MLHLCKIYSSIISSNPQSDDLGILIISTKFPTLSVSESLLSEKLPYTQDPILQSIGTCLQAFQSVGLDVYLKPYRVVATAPGSGVIEVVPNSKTRDELGKKTDETLYHHFIKV